ncbi:MAG: dihydroorotate dehydrogenase [Treponema sp.]|jgi:dihydroorotate dehydrogenase (NAD+) catalytic subunit|nr:dihydroorotate dehydrogenase [Treponema sp.]
MNENMMHENTIHENTIIDLSVNIAGIRLKNPVIAASGTFGNGKEYSQIFDTSKLGAICTIGLTMPPRDGNTGIRIWETPSGLLNSIGLENPGIPSFIENDLPFLKNLGPAIIANLSGSSSDEYIQGAILLNESSVDMVELNISCPNVREGGMAFGLDAGTAAALTAAVRRVCTNKPLIVKLSPNAPSIFAVALACVRAGADGLSLVNTIRAMAIDTVNRKPVFDNITAGLSGPAIKPIALRMVWDLYKGLNDENIKIPVIGMGGISNANDALEYLMAGASAVQVGTASFLDPFSMLNIIDDIQSFMETNNIQNLAEISIRG